MRKAARVCALLVAVTGASKALDPELALRPPRVIADPGPAYGDANRAWQGIPTIARSPGGRLYASWYSGGEGEGPRNYVLLVHSDDDGETWSRPQLVLDPGDAVRGFDPCLWADPDGRVWLFWAQSAGRWDGRGGVWSIVTDEPDVPSPAWSAPRRIADGVMLNKPTVLANGQWLLPVSGWRFKEPVIETELAKVGFADAADAGRLWARSLGDRAGAMVWASADRGETFSYRGQALVPEPQHDEHMIVERRDGSLWMLVRTSYGIGESVSRDGGATWSPGGPSGIPHPVSRFHIRRLRSGRLLMVRHVPDRARPKLRTNLTAYLSDDDGKTWRGGLLLDDREHVSYPDVAEAQDATLYVVYDRERGGAKQILMARITEADILAGEVASHGSALRLLVNQAGGR